MDKQIIEISNNGFHLSLFRGFLVIEHKEQSIKNKVALDNILALILSANNVIISKNIITAICEQGGTVIFCNNNYIPSAITLPYTKHWLMSTRIKQQLNCSVPLQKNLWKNIIKHKISNQALILKHFFPQSPQIEHLNYLSKETLSNDINNHEGQAASIYFKVLFGNQFIRNRANNDVNILLNYIYTVLRAMVARAVSGNGLLPYIGIKHCNKMNQLPLIDDLIEPFRPLADKIVVNTLKNITNIEQIELSPEIKRNLTTIINYPVETEKGMISLNDAIYDFVASLVMSYELKKVLLRYPLKYIID